MRKKDVIDKQQSRHRPHLINDIYFTVKASAMQVFISLQSPARTVTGAFQSSLPSEKVVVAESRRRKRGRHVSSTNTAILLLMASVVLVTTRVNAFYPGPHQPIWRDKRRIVSEIISETTLSSSSSSDSSNREHRRRNNNNSAALNVTVVSASMELEMLHRVSQLELLVAKQTVELKRLKQECEDLTHAAAAFARVVELLREAGLQTSEADAEIISGRSPGDEEQEERRDSSSSSSRTRTVVESFDDSQIFGTAPSDVIEAADVAGAAILAGMLAGKHRMLVDVRDADLSRDPDTLVQFIELAILPVAAGLEGLKSKRNRLKIIFPTVSQLSQFRKTMALAAPEVVALSTLGFDPVEDQDNLVVIVAPSPDDEEGLEAMNALLDPDNATERKLAEKGNSLRRRRQRIKQPVVVLNHHMLPITGPAARFEVAYHLRLLSVQYMTEAPRSQGHLSEVQDTVEAGLDCGESGTVGEKNATAVHLDTEAELEAAVERAHQIGMLQGMTRAMVVRAYPQPWHVFVDTSPDTDADFAVAATFDDEPTQEEVNLSIVECLQGSEEEDEIVAQQMQQALETGQLDRVSGMLGSMGLEIFDEDEEDEDEDLWKNFDEDSV